MIAKDSRTDLVAGLAPFLCEKVQPSQEARGHAPNLGNPRALFSVVPSPADVRRAHA